MNADDHTKVSLLMERIYLAYEGLNPYPSYENLQDALLSVAAHEFFVKHEEDPDFAPDGKHDLLKRFERLLDEQLREILA